MSDKESPAESLKEIVGPLSSDELNRYFVPRSDLTHRTLNNLNITDADVRQSLFTGSLIRECSFTRVVFKRSDLDGLRIERSTFVECDLSSCDYRSIIFSECRFQSCNFNTSFIDDCEFHLSELTQCNFNDCSLTRCRFFESSLINCSVVMATLLHNKLYKCALADIILGDCSLLYFIIRNCSLTRVSINAESIGAILGLTIEQLEQINIIYLGEKQVPPPDADIVGLINEEYSRRRWFVAQLILALNFQTTAAISAFSSYMSRSYERFVELGFAKGEELDFLADVLEELASLERLPLLTALDLIEWCNSLESDISLKHPKQPSRFYDSLHAFMSRVALLANSLIDKLDSAVPKEVLETPNLPLCVRVTFNEKPAVPLLNVLNWIDSLPNLKIDGKSRLIDTSTGSYVEYVYTTLLTVYALKIFLFHLNGCLIQLTELKVRTSVLLARRTPRSYLDLARSPSPQILPLVQKLLPPFTDQAKKLASSNEQLLGGYDKTNIESLVEVECSSPSTKRTKSRKPRLKGT